MCQCACGDFSGDVVFPAPDGDVYVLDVYPGCEDCDTPAGVVLYRFTRKEAEHWGVDRVKPTRITAEGNGFPVLDPNILRKLMEKEAAAGLAEVVKDIIADGFRNHFRDAGHRTFEKWRRRASPSTNGSNEEG